MYDKSSKFSEEMLIHIFIEVDDACNLMQEYVQSHWIGTEAAHSKPTRQPRLSPSETMTILIFYHYSGFKCFEYYYRRLVLQDLHSYFPEALSYNRFLELIPRVLLPLQIFAKMSCAKSEQTGIYYIDSKKLPVCHNKRIPNHKVFKDIAGRGKSSMGWFYGFKIHLIINQKGEPMNFQITAGNISDNNQDLLRQLLKKVKGTCFGDKGYLTKVWEELYEKGLKLVTKLRKKMKNKLIVLQERYLLAKRAVIESVNDIFTSVFDMEHSRHRKPENALAHILSAFCAYCFYPDKPSINIPNAVQEMYT